MNALLKSYPPAAASSGATICARLRVSRPIVTTWLNRYEAAGVGGLLADRPRSGRPKQLSAADEAAIIDRTLRTAPPDGGPHWSTRALARVTGYHHATIARLWHAHGLQPHRVPYFTLS